jgi:predicted transcriptional regulator of viral defense system
VRQHGADVNHLHAIEDINNKSVFIAGNVKDGDRTAAGDDYRISVRKVAANLLEISPRSL